MRNLAISTTLTSNLCSGRTCRVPAQPGQRLAGFGGDGLPGPALRPALGDEVRDGRVAEAGCHPVRSLPGCVTFRGVADLGQPMTAERGIHGVVRETDLGSNGIDAPMPHKVPFPQVASYVSESQAAQDRDPASVRAIGPQLPGGVSDRWVPVLSGLGILLA